MITKVLNVDGMSCSHCENAVNKAVGQLEGVKSVSADAKSKTVTVTFDETLTALKSIIDTIDEEGYEVIS